MIALSETRPVRRGLADVVGVDIASTGVKAVRMKRSKEGLTVVEAAMLPPVSPEADAEGKPVRIQLPKPVRSKSLALSYSAPDAVVRLLSLPGFSPQAATADQVIREHVGLDAAYRMGYSITAPARGRADVSLVAVGVPNAEAEGLLQLVRTASTAPVSMEISALAVLTAFAHGPLSRAGKQAVGLIEAGANVAVLAIFSQGTPILLRKFDFGSSRIECEIQRSFGVDEATSLDMLSTESFDISHQLQRVTGSFLRQLSISKEFVERKAGTPVAEWYVAGGLALTTGWRRLIAETVGKDVQVWNPLENLYLVPGRWPEPLKGQEVRFAAAIGAAVGALEDQ